MLKFYIKLSFNSLSNKKRKDAPREKSKSNAIDKVENRIAHVANMMTTRLVQGRVWRLVLHTREGRIFRGTHYFGCYFPSWVASVFTSKDVFLSKVFCHSNNNALKAYRGQELQASNMKSDCVVQHSEVHNWVVWSKKYSQKCLSYLRSIVTIVDGYLLERAYFSFTIQFINK